MFALISTKNFEHRMEIYSSINQNESIIGGQESKHEASAANNSALSEYERLNAQYTKNGFTYKSNEILLKVSENNPSEYPYLLLLQTAKTFHLNQFQIIFLSHILEKVEPCYLKETEIFTEHMQLSEEALVLISEILESSGAARNRNSDLLELNEQEYDMEGEEENPNNGTQFSQEDLRKIYMYLLVIGYAVKYYLNEQSKVKPYEEEVKKTHPSFFTSVFNRWAKTYGNTVLATTPRNINSFYMGLGFMNGEEDNNEEQAGEDCQHRNYNEIVEELIKATTEGEELPMDEIKQEFQEPYNE